MTITQKMWALDPGYFKLKNAIKTTLSFLISVFLAYHFLGEMPAVLAGFAAVFTTRGVMDDDPWQKRLLAILIAGVCSFLAYLAAAFLKPHVMFLEMLLVVLAFCALYVRRFGPRFMLPPINVWAICLIGGMLPHEPPYLIVLNASAYLMGLFISTVIYFSVFSPDKRRLYYANINQLKNVFVESLLWLEQYFINGVPRDTFLDKNRDLMEEIVKLVAVNGTILEAMSNADSGTSKKFAKNQMISYALQKDFSILFEGFSGLVENKMEVTRELKQLMLSTFLHLGFLIQQIQVDAENEKISIDKTLVPFEDYLQKIQNYLNTFRIDQREELIPVLNICLGLRLIWRNLW